MKEQALKRQETVKTTAAATTFVTTNSSDIDGIDAVDIIASQEQIEIPSSAAVDTDTDIVS